MKHLAPVLLWSLLILVLSTLPGRTIPKVGFELFVSWDKLAHAFVYAVLVMLAGKHLRFKGKFKGRNLVIAVLLSILYGVLMESIQHYFLSDRFFEIPDLIANIIGSIVGAVFIYIKLNKTKNYEPV